MKMIYVASLSKQPDRDSAWVDAFSELGWSVETYSSDLADRRGTLATRLKNRFHLGAEWRQMREGLLERVRALRPQWVHFRLPIAFDRRTIEEIRNTGALVTEYFNDDPFSPRAPIGLNWRFVGALSAYDAHFVYRDRNVADFKNAGAAHVFTCPPAYNPKHRPNSRNADGQFLADVAFMGHWEADQRTDCVEALQRAGFSVVLHGSGWDAPLAGGPLQHLRPVQPLFGEGYNHVYANVVAGLCFFSKLNRDQWTERPLEIVAVGGVLVCERTHEAQGYFHDRSEAMFFSDVTELVDICRILKFNHVLRTKIQTAGLERLLKDGHTVRHRAEQIERFVRLACSQNDLSIE